jgi:dihydropteroate synthase
LNETPNWRVRGREIAIARPFVFGILNVTPDSFSDGGLFLSTDAAVAHVDRMVAEGADGVDIGGQSTRPQGAREVSVDEEIERVVPVIAAVRARYPVLPVSVDTTKSAVAEAAVNAGADVINDVSAFRLDPRMGEIVASTGAGAILMHSRGGVSDMGTYRFAEYGDDIVAEIRTELVRSISSALEAGVNQGSIVVDPGIGFAKRSEHSLRVLAELPRITALGFPVAVGVSRKRFVGDLSRVERAADRVAGSVAANVASLLGGARLFRVHDVLANRQGLDVAWGILTATDSRFPIPDSRC